MFKICKRPHSLFCTAFCYVTGTINNYKYLTILKSDNRFTALRAEFRCIFTIFGQPSTGGTALDCGRLRLAALGTELAGIALFTA